jgi:ABC-2 type transport system ATP-binding protein
VSTTAINIEQLSKRYSGEMVDSLSNVNLQINEGDKFGILGPNGAGKTTLISILCGILEQSSGYVHYNLNNNNIKESIGFVPQDYAFYEELSPVQNLEYFGAMYKLTAKQTRLRTEQLLTILGLIDVKNKKVGSFSGGMKRRMNLAIGIIHEPKILFLDEPTVGVDVQSKLAIIRFLNELNEKGTTIIYTSHHLDEAQEFCNHISLIDHGKIITTGKTQALLDENKVTDLKELLIKFTGEDLRD